MRPPSLNSTDEKLWNAFWHELFRTAFHVSVVATLLFALLDTIGNGFVRYFFPLAIFPWSVGVTGTALLILQTLPQTPLRTKADSRWTRIARFRGWRIPGALLGALLGGAFIYAQTVSLGAYRWGIAIAAGALLAFVFLLEQHGDGDAGEPRQTP